MNRLIQKCQKRKAAFLVIASVIVNAVMPPILSALPRSNSASPRQGLPQQPAAFQLTIDNIMRGPGLVGYELRAVRWSADSRLVFFEWKLAGDPFDKDYDTYEVGRDGTGLKKLSEEEAKQAPPFDGELSKDKKLKVYAREGDIFLYDNAAGQRTQLTSTTDVEQDPHFTKDGKHVYFTRSGNLYVLGLDNGSLVQMTDIRLAGAAEAARPPAGGGGGGLQQQQRREASEQKGTDSQEYLKKEERDLLDVVKERAKKREEDEAKRKRENPRKPFNLLAGQFVQSLQLSPDEKHVVASIATPGQGSKNTVVPNFVTESGYTEDISGRNKVGDNQVSSKLAVIDAQSGEVTWVDHGLRAPGSGQGSAKDAADRKGAEQPENAASGTKAEDSQSSAQSSLGAASDADKRQGSDSGQGRGEHKSARNTDREVALFMPVWSDDGSKAVLLARSTDNKDKWIMALDPATGKTRILTTDHDDAWEDGPGSFTLGWLADDDHIYFQSERTGFSHLYTCAFSDGQIKQLTSGKWEVTGVRLSSDKGHFLLTTSEVGPGERHFYSLPVTGGQSVRMTSAAGSNEAVQSPDEKTLALVYSYSNKPPELYVQDSRAGSSAVKVTSSPAPEFWTYPWIDPPLVTITARDGATIDGKLFKPKDFKRGGPAVIFVHGAGYAQDVDRWWSNNYYREYLFHHFLMEHGYLVLEVDYRGSAGYGRDWRTGIYRHMGGKDLDDHVDAARWLAREQGVDPARVGIYGGSYGGFMTLMALFTQPDVFAAGAALRPVTDWAHYNHPYTSNILNLPQKDAEAYEKSSPIFFAAGLKGALLICHGMADTNVHFQDTVRLVQKLIELRKENWEVAVYPVENHGFVEPSSWADEYKRIFRLFETNLKGPKSAAGGSSARR
jgi:dipeptidyl aminopeptidase/acylaminoacyl peptidase